MKINREQYFDIIRKKTATLIAACTACGAKSVGCDSETVQNMKQFGEYIGIAFQIKDDLFDYQAKGLIGKPTGNDIKEKKLTLPLIYALENSSFIERRHILRTINKDNTNSEKVKIIVDFVISKGGLEYTSQMMYEYRDKAINMLSSYPSSDVKTSLIDLVNYTIERDK